MAIDEAARLAALRSYRILDTDSEQAFDDLALLASHICQTPITLANRKAPNATQKCARQSRSTFRTGNPPVGVWLELIVGQHLYRRPHFAVS